MIGGHHVIEEAQAEAFPGFKQPVQIPVAVACEFQQKALLMAAMGDVPELARQEVAVGAWHVALPGALVLLSVTGWQVLGMTIGGGKGATGICVPGRERANGREMVKFRSEWPI